LLTNNLDDTENMKYIYVLSCSY